MLMDSHEKEPGRAHSRDLLPSGGHRFHPIKSREFIFRTRSRFTGKKIFKKSAKWFLRNNRVLLPCVIIGGYMLKAYDRAAGRPVTGGWIALGRSGQSARGLAHAQTLRARGACGERASVLECGGPPPLWLAPNCKRAPQKLRSFFILHFPFFLLKNRRPSAKTRCQTQSDPVRPLKFLKMLATAKITRLPKPLRLTARPQFMRLQTSCSFITVFWGFKVIQGYSRLNFFPAPNGLRTTHIGFSVRTCVHVLLITPHASFPRQRIQLALQLRLGGWPGDFIRQLASLEKQHHRHDLHLIILRQPRRFIRVDLHKLDLAGVVARHPVQQRSQLPAGLAPGRIKIHHHRPRIMRHLIGKIHLGHVLDVRRGIVHGGRMVTTGDRDHRDHGCNGARPPQVSVKQPHGIQFNHWPAAFKYFQPQTGCQISIPAYASIMLTLEQLAGIVANHRAAASARVQEFALDGRPFSFNSRPAIMGVVNLSADSWYRESVCLSADAAIQRGRVLAAQGADLIDVGAESTLAHAARADQAAQKSRLLPVIRALRAEKILVSVETYSPAVTRACLAAGANVLNLTGTTGSSEIFRLVAAHDAAVIICYVAGKNVREVRDFDLRADPIPMLREFFARQVELARRQGVGKIILDPGLGFYYRNLQDSAVRVRHQMNIFLNTFRLRDLGCPICHALPHAFEFFREDVRCAEPFFAVLAALGKTDLFRTHEVPRIRAVLETLRGWGAAEPQPGKNCAP